MGLAIAVFFHAIIFLSLPLKIDLLRRAEGWLDFAQHVQQARRQTRPDLLIAGDYAPASIMQFYLPDHPVTYLPPAPYGKTQFTLWPEYEVKPGTHALYVSAGEKPLPDKVRDEFDQWQKIDDFWSLHRGRPTTHFHIYLLTKS